VGPCGGQRSTEPSRAFWSTLQAKHRADDRRCQQQKPNRLHVAKNTTGTSERSVAGTHFKPCMQPLRLWVRSSGRALSPEKYSISSVAIWSTIGGI
jgi:hypothetical protein